MEAAGFEVVHCRRFCKLGSLAWWVSGRVFRKRHLSPRQMIWFDRLLGTVMLLDFCLPVPGMSLMMVGRRPDAGSEGPGAAVQRSVQGRQVAEVNRP
jgi:hypothetical protein